MTDKGTLTLEYQVRQSRLVKRLRAENSRLRHRLLRIEELIEAGKPLEQIRLLIHT